MNAGAMDRRITVTQTGATNTGTGWTETTTTLGTMWASRKDVSDGEKVAAGTVMGTVAARFVVRSSTVTRQIIETALANGSELLLAAPPMLVQAFSVILLTLFFVWRDRRKRGA